MCRIYRVYGYQNTNATTNTCQLKQIPWEFKASFKT